MLTEIEDEDRIKYEVEQSLISKKKELNTFSVNRELVNSKSFHDKFILLPINNEVRESVYKETGRLLEFVDGKSEEKLTALTFRTGEHIVDNFYRDGYTYVTSFIFQLKLILYLIKYYLFIFVQEKYYHKIKCFSI